MKKLLLIAAFLLPTTALAIPCPKGSNVRLSDKTASSKVKAQQAALKSASSSNTTKSVSLKNHYPH